MKHYSEQHKKYLRGLLIKKYLILGIQIGLLISIFALWELFTSIGWLDSFIISSPTRIVKTIILLFNDGSLFKHIGVTLYETVLGFIIATLAGTIIASLLWWNEWLRRVLEPYIVVLNSLPKIALGPVIIIWMGAGTKAIVTMCVLICIIITIISMLNSFLSCEHDKILLMQSMGANKSDIFFSLVLPHSVPDLISVLKINVGMSWVGTIMGEYLVSKAGLGYLIVYGGQVFRLDLVMSSTLLLCVMASIMYFTVAYIEKRIHKFRSGS